MWTCSEDLQVSSKLWDWLCLGADVNAESVAGYTVLMYACFGTVDVVEALLSAGKSLKKPITSVC